MKHFYISVLIAVRANSQRHMTQLLQFYWIKNSVNIIFQDFEINFFRKYSFV